jgi:hypothetical protein
VASLRQLNKVDLGIYPGVKEDNAGWSARDSTGVGD